MSYIANSKVIKKMKTKFKSCKNIKTNLEIHKFYI